VEGRRELMWSELKPVGEEASWWNNWQLVLKICTHYVPYTYVTDISNLIYL